MQCKTEALYDPWFQLAVFEPQDATEHYTVSLLLKAPMSSQAGRHSLAAQHQKSPSHLVCDSMAVKVVCYDIVVCRA